MKKEYINPEMLVVEVETMGMLALSKIDEGATSNEMLSPSYGYDEEDEEDWEDDGKASRNGRRGY